MVKTRGSQLEQDQKNKQRKSKSQGYRSETRPRNLNDPLAPENIIAVEAKLRNCLSKHRKCIQYEEVLQLEERTRIHMKKRIQKQAKYSPLETLTMRMLKSKNLYKISKKIANINNIPERKNFSIVAMRLGFFLHYKIHYEGIPKQEAIENIFRRLVSALPDCLHKKYRRTINPEVFIQLVKLKNLRDLSVFQAAMSVDLRDHRRIEKIIGNLYELKLDGTPYHNNIRGERIAMVLIEALELGPLMLRQCFKEEWKFELCNGQPLSIHGRGEEEELQNESSQSESKPQVWKKKNGLNSSQESGPKQIKQEEPWDLGDQVEPGKMGQPYPAIAPYQVKMEAPAYYPAVKLEQPPPALPEPQVKVEYPTRIEFSEEQKYMYQQQVNSLLSLYWLPYLPHPTPTL